VICRRLGRLFQTVWLILSDAIIRLVLFTSSIIYFFRECFEFEQSFYKIGTRRKCLRGKISRIIKIVIEVTCTKEVSVLHDLVCCANCHLIQATSRFFVHEIYKCRYVDKMYVKLFVFKPVQAENHCALSISLSSGYLAKFLPFHYYLNTRILVGFSVWPCFHANAWEIAMCWLLSNDSSSNFICSSEPPLPRNSKMRWCGPFHAFQHKVD